MSALVFVSFVGPPMQRQITKGLQEARIWPTPTARQLPSPSPTAIPPPPSVPSNVELAVALQPSLVRSGLVAWRAP